MNRLVAVACAASMLLTLACSSGGGGGGQVIAPPPTASYVDGGAAAAADVVRFTGQASADEVEVTVRIGGASTSSDIFGFAFDLELGDPSVVQLVDGSAVFGDALTLGGGQQPQALASQIGSRVVVGVSKLGGGAGNGIAPGESTVVSLRLRVIQTGSSTIKLAVPASALDSTGAVVGSVLFDTTESVISGN